MFSTLNEKYQKTISDTEDEKLIMEAITGSDMDPSIEAAAEDEVDVYSVPRKDLDRLDKFADKLVSSSDYDDEDLDDLLDDGYEDAIVVAEASVTTPSGDKPGDYNSGIKSGKVDYNMNDCEDRGGVGVNSVIARNSQLSESTIMLMMNESAANYQLDALLEEASEETDGAAKESKIKAAKAAIVKFGKLILDKLRWLGGLIVKVFRAGGEQLKKMMDNVIAHTRQSDLGMVKISTGVYDNSAYRKITNTIGTIEKKFSSFSKDIHSESDYGIGADAGSIKVDTSLKEVTFVEANKMIYAYNKGDTKNYQKCIDRLVKIVTGLNKVAETSSDETVIKNARSAQKAINAAVASLTKVFNAHKRNMDAAAVATKRYAKSAEKLGEKMGAGREKAEAKNAAKRNAEQEKEAKTKTSYSYSSDAAFAAKRKAAAEKAAKNAANVKNESVMRFDEGIFDEAADTYFFAYELNEAQGFVDSNEYFELFEAGNATTYDETPSHLKTDGTLKVDPPKVDAHPKDDMSKRDPARPGLTNEVSLAKNTLCKAYTADQLAAIPSSKMGVVRTAITDTIATKSAAISSLKESYEAHLGDSYEVRSAILEDASVLRRDLDNLKHNLALVEDIMETSGNGDLDALAESVFGEGESVDESFDDWSFLFEDSEADLDDLDMSDGDGEKDSGKDEKDDDDEKDDKKSKKSEKSKKDDDEECDDGECDDKDKDDDDDKKSKKSDKSDKDKDDDKKEDEEDVDESASLLAVIGDLMAALD